MSELDYIGTDELVFNNDVDGGIHSGGFSVNSIMLKAGMSPIMTINNEQTGGDNNKVSDLFNNLVVPNWALSYNNRIMSGGKYNEDEHNNSDSDDDVIDDDLHDKLLGLVQEHNIQQGKGLRKKTTRRNKKYVSKKGTIKRNKRS
jgi:hypothetical protein